MKPKKPKSNRAPIAVLYASEEAMIGALNRYVELKCSLAARKAALEAQIAALTATHDTEVQADREELATLEASLQLFCQNKRAELFTDKKSREYSTAVIGFRDTPASVGKVVSRDTFGAIALRLCETEWGEGFVRYPEPELDKKSLLAKRAEVTAAQLAEVGLKFEEGEEFFISPKAESAERVSKPVGEVAA